MMVWHNPLPIDLIPTDDSDSFREHDISVETGLPIGNHVGAFGTLRKNHHHEGVDLYAPEGTAVRAVEAGVVVAVLKFTGPSADPPSPWWHDTDAVMVEGESGVVLYGEVTSIREVGDTVEQGALLGYVIEVLTKDKGRPTSMLHLELHKPGTRDAYEWLDERPASLLDPTDYLLDIIAI